MLSSKIFDKPEINMRYLPSKDEQKKIWYVKDRIAAMQQARIMVDKNWDIYQQMIDAIWMPYPSRWKIKF